MDDLIKKIDIYELLQVNFDANVQEIKKAYRKKALTCHPDKNPDNPKAAEEFRQLSKALELLCDEKARAAYDKILKNRREAKERYKNLDSKRKKFKDDLVAKEKAAREEQEAKARDEEKLAREIERLKKEGSKIVEEELDLLKKQLEKNLIEIKLKENEVKLPRLKCKWYKKNDFDELYLRNKFGKFGKISCLVLSKKGTSAIVEFEKIDHSFKISELNSDTFKVEWIQGNPESESFNDDNFRNFSRTNKSRSKVLFDEDYEKLVLKKLNDAYLKQINQV